MVGKGGQPSAPHRTLPPTRSKSWGPDSPPSVPKPPGVGLSMIVVRTLLPLPFSPPLAPTTKLLCQSNLRGHKAHSRARLRILRIRTTEFVPWRGSDHEKSLEDFHGGARSLGNAHRSVLSENRNPPWTPRHFFPPWTPRHLQNEGSISLMRCAVNGVC